MDNSTGIPAELSGVVNVGVVQEELKVRVYVPVGAPVPEYVVEIDPDVGKQHVELDHVTELKVLVAEYFAIL